MSETKLTTKQRLFVEHYLGRANANATEAARLTGYKGSDKTLSVVGAENLAKPCIAELVEERIAIVGMSVNEIISELFEIAKTKLGTTEHIKATDKIKALELLGKRFAMWTENHKHEGALKIEIEYV